MKRRTFLKNTGLASAALFAPAFLQRPSLVTNGKILIVVQLSGGNDGLNTVIPYRNDKYYELRPDLAIARQDVLNLTDELGFNPSLEDLRPLYDQGHLSIINNVGYPNPDRSHFRSMDIWQTAANSNEYLTTGWLGRYLDSRCTGCDVPHHALEFGQGLSLALKGVDKRGFALNDIQQMARTNRNPLLRYLAQQDAHDHEHEQVAYLYKTLLETQSSTAYLLEKTEGKRTRANFPATPFGRDLRQVADLILAGSDTKIYYVSLGGFDTHANQAGPQGRLLSVYAEGMKALAEELQQHNLWQDTLVMTFSEFGRRVAQNGSRGTDHGAASNLFLMGGNLRQPGFYNEGPNLEDLLEGDLKYKVDFRQVYATVLDKWLAADAKSVIGKGFDGLGVL
ncbi:DUF1501 domain-containing protein [Lewinella cohaerens]|uniref:DUF1501 domain-containing protein n=1 Tax=Lewinella cohaerens TaxID=70995 RepID=UPI0003645DF8|nr:DUF1501 domain-containing protein [Lewinella cohaerens]